MGNEILSAQEFATEMKWNIHTVYRKLRSGKIKGHHDKQYNRWKIHRDEVVRIKCEAGDVNSCVEYENILERANQDNNLEFQQEPANSNYHIVPTWIAPFAERLRLTLCVPEPNDLFLKDISHGRVPVSDHQGDIEGLFFWNSEDGQPYVKLYDYTVDETLEYDQYYDQFLKYRQDVKLLMDGFKEFGRQYILSAYTLLHEMRKYAEDEIARIMSSALLGSTLPEFNLFDKKTCLQMPDLYVLVIFGEYLRSAHKCVIESECKPLQSPIDHVKKYKYSEVNSDVMTFTFGTCISPLATGKNEVIGELTNQHSTLIHEFLTSRSAFAKEVIRNAKQTRDICQQLKFIL